MKKETQQLIDEVMDNFDFEEAAYYFDAMKWTYTNRHNNEEYIPEIYDLKRVARERIESAIKCHGMSSCGRLEARYWQDADGWNLSLKLVPIDAVACSAEFTKEANE